MHNLGIFFNVSSKIIFTEDCFLIFAIDLTTRGLLYTCLVLIVFVNYFPIAEMNLTPQGPLYTFLVGSCFFFIFSFLFIIFAHNPIPWVYLTVSLIITLVCPSVVHWSIFRHLNNAD